MLPSDQVWRRLPGAGDVEHCRHLPVRPLIRDGWRAGRCAIIGYAGQFPEIAIMYP
jgi:hypothetical protein